MGGVGALGGGSGMGGVGALDRERTDSLTRRGAPGRTHVRGFLQGVWAPVARSVLFRAVLPGRGSMHALVRLCLSYVRSTVACTQGLDEPGSVSKQDNPQRVDEGEGNLLSFAMRACVLP